MTEAKTSGKLWMWGLILSIASFVLFFTGFAIWALRGEPELVYENYYEKDVAYEEQIRAIDRTQKLLIKPTMKYERSPKTLVIHFPSTMGHKNPSGEVKLFRPADLNKDQIYPIKLDGDTLQVLPLVDLDPGLWRFQLSWTNNNDNYYLENQIFVTK